VTSTALRDLAADPTTLGDWAGVVADLAHQLAHDIPDQSRYDADADRRAPSAGLRRYLEIRDRSCAMIGCRAPAHTADKDHTHDHAKGGATIGPNLGDACRHDHRLKGEGGWALQQPAPGVFRWTSRLGHTYDPRTRSRSPSTTIGKTPKSGTTSHPNPTLNQIRRPNPTSTRTSRPSEPGPPSPGSSERPAGSPPNAAWLHHDTSVSEGRSTTPKPTRPA
jgi:hypothetical protein